jgi:hypothetical protein
MELNHESIAEQAMQQEVDLHRLYVEILESLVTKVGVLAKIPNNAVLEIEESEAKRCKLRELGFEGLKNGKWVPIVGLCDVETTFLDELQSYIEVIGRTVRINNPEELKTALATYSCYRNSIPRDPFMDCLAETALNQALDVIRIGRIEMAPAHNQCDLDLIEQNPELVQLIRAKMSVVLDD